MSRFQIWLEATRPKTLPAAICPVMVGSALAFDGGSFVLSAALLCLVFGLLIQVGTNFANDYFDGVKGTDTAARIGPRRAVASGDVSGRVMKRAAVVTLAVAFCIGLALISFGGWWLLAVGIASVVSAWAYTGGPYPLAYNALGDVFVLIFFGFVAVGCTYYVQAGALNADVFLAALACGLLINNILVVNNYRDIEEDRLAGKRTLAVLLGRRFAAVIYAVSVFLAGAIVVLLSVKRNDGFLLLALLSLLPSLPVIVQLPKLAQASEYLWALKSSGLVVAAFGLLFAAGVVL